MLEPSLYGLGLHSCCRANAVFVPLISTDWKVKMEPSESAVPSVSTVGSRGVSERAAK